jgi:prepilin-type N-terminal cleavage/methylation domain-containing protein
MKRRAGQRGFTVIEVMIGALLITILSLAMVGTFAVGYRTLSQEARQIAADSAVNGADMALTRDLSMATVLPTGTIGGGSTVVFAYGPPGSNAVVYSIDGSKNLIRTLNGAAQVVARGMSSVTISAVACYATVTLQPSAVGAAARTLNVANRPGGCV